MSTNPLRRGCSPAQTFPFSTSAAGLHGPPPRRRAGAPRSSSANLMNGNITDEPFRSQEPAFLSKTPGISYKETNGIGQHAPYLFHAGNAIPEPNNGKTAGKRPEKMHIRRSKQIRHKGEHDLQGRTHPRTDGNRRPDNDAHSARIPPITKETAE